MTTATFPNPNSIGPAFDDMDFDTSADTSVLDRNLFLVKEHVGLFKASSNYDVYDPQTGEIILHCREPRLGWITQALRFTDYKRMTPFDVHITTPDGRPVVQVTRGVTLFTSNVSVRDGRQTQIGSFKQKLLSIGGAFAVLDSQGTPVCQLKGSWIGWDFKFEANGHMLAKVSKKWTGIGKELFTSADNYVLEISEQVPPASTIRKLILAAVMTIDMVIKE